MSLAGRGGETKEWQLNPVESSTADQSADATGAVDSLPIEVRTLLRAAGMQAEAVLEITRLTSPLQKKRNFRVDTTDGRRVKARLFPTTERRQRVAALMPLLAGLPFARILAHGGRVTLEEWIEGNALDPLAVTVALARQAGDILGSLHTRGGYDDTYCAGMPDTRALLERLDRHLEVVQLHGAASAKQCRQLAMLARDHCPDSLDSGLIHADFCLDNMVLTASGELFLVDNEDLRVGVLDYDLARCWSRWPMTPGQRRAFLEGYEHYRSASAFTAHKGFWGVIALVMSLQVFLRHGHSRLDLQEALLHLARGATEDLWPRS